MVLNGPKLIGTFILIRICSAGTCVGTEVEGGGLCTAVVTDCSGHYAVVGPGTAAQCGSTGTQCVTVGPFCDKPKPKVLKWRKADGEYQGVCNGHDDDLKHLANPVSDKDKEVSAAIKQNFTWISNAEGSTLGYFVGSHNFKDAEKCKAICDAIPSCVQISVGYRCFPQTSYKCASGYTWAGAHFKQNIYIKD
mmetsp:Transcript_44827/g.80587  ORF Transcript_44827/g.80587 Transcript_44827/m.80587 type:complete len:193 (+) Transcript_44827:90-668(+)